MDAQHPRLVHLAAAVVGASHSRVALREVSGDNGRAHSPFGLLPLLRRNIDAGNGRAGYMVFLRTAAVYSLRLAGKNARPGCLLSHTIAGDGIRHSLLLGGAHDYA